jgi:endonuclease VIII
VGAPFATPAQEVEVPEGPEVRRAAQRIERSVGGRPLRAVSLWSPQVAGEAEGLRAAGLVAAETTGKAMILRFADGRGIYVHLQLYGRWRFGRSPAPAGRTLRIALIGARSGAFLYSATELALLDPGEVHPFVAEAGPDPLFDGADAMAAALAGAPRRALGAALLDPRRIAGIGNYLRAEILWEAELAPTRTWASLGAAERAALCAALVAVPRRALAQGSTVPEPFAAQMDSLPPRARRHAAYGRAGLACLRCDDVIVTATIGARPLYYCPVCQR